MNFITLIGFCILSIAFAALVYFHEVQSIKANAPSFLVTLGIFFMFIGVGVGLYKFDLMANPAQEIKGLLQHIQVAFIVSTIGVFYSILYKAIFYFAKNEQKREDLLESRLTTYLDNNEKSFLIQQCNEKELSELNRSLMKILGEISTNISNIFSTYQQQETQSRNYEASILSRLKSLQESNENFITNQTEKNNEIFINALKAAMINFNKELESQFASNFPKLNEALENVINWQDANIESITENHAILRQINESYLEQQKQFDLLKNYTNTFVEMHTVLDQSVEQLNHTTKDLDIRIDQLENLGKTSIFDTEKYRDEMESVYKQVMQLNVDFVDNMKLYQQRSIDISNSLEQVIEVNKAFRENSLEVYDKNLEYSKKVYLNQVDLVEKIGLHQMKAIDEFKNKVDKQIYDVHMDLTDKFEMTNAHLNKIDSLIDNQFSLIKNIQAPKNAPETISLGNS